MARDPDQTLPRSPLGRPLRVAFLGSPALALPTLEVLLARPELCSVEVVVAQPDKPAGRGRTLKPPPVAARARELGLRLLQPRRVRSGAFPQAMEDLDLDVAVVIAYGRILTTRLLEAPRYGCVNVHASLLPRWRGAGPIQWSIIGGDERTGVTTMWMEEGLDTGPMLLRREEPIGPQDTAATLGQRLGALGAELAAQTLVELQAGRLRATPQPAEGVTLAPLLTKGDGLLRWDQPADALERRMRGVSPWPGAWCPWRGKVLKVHGARVEPSSDAPARPGEIVAVDDDGVRVRCGEGDLCLTRVQPPGKRAMDIAAFLRGRDLRVGELLTAPEDRT